MTCGVYSRRIQHGPNRMEVQVRTSPYGGPATFAQKMRSRTWDNTDRQEKAVKKLALTGSVVALFLGNTAVLAQTPADEHAGHHPPGATTPAKPSAMPPAPPSARPSTQATSPAAMPQMQDNLKKMQDLMTRLRASKNPTERQQLMQQHSKAMMDQMGMMRGMGSGQGGTTKGDGMMNHDMMDHQAMQSRMDMMQMMMDQMLQHQEAQQDQKPVK